MKVKICGVSDVETAVFAAKEGAAAIGFVFAESIRRVSPETAGKISKALPSPVWKVGVFVHSPPKEVSDIAQRAGLTHVQLHGDENPSDYRCLGLEIIQSISVSSETDMMKAMHASADYILLDGPAGPYKGGNGRTFDWELVNLLKQRKGIILAGGLNESNISEAIGIVEPEMVDVSSGVETSGCKDLGKIERFIKKAKSYSRG